MALHFHIFKIKSKLISTCCDKSDGLSHDKLRAVSDSKILAQITILHRISLGKQLK